MKAKEYICLNCETRQDKPDNPLGWCEKCGGKRIEHLNNVRFVPRHEPTKMSGYVWMGYDEGLIYCDNFKHYLLTDFIISGALDTKHDAQIVASQWEADHVHLIKTDDVETALKIINEAVGDNIRTLGKRGASLVNLSQEQVDYICSISSYHNGRFNFNKEVPK